MLLRFVDGRPVSLVRVATRPSPPFAVQAHDEPRPSLVSHSALGRTAFLWHRLEVSSLTCLSTQA
jgi:hypothetical protein